MRKYVPLVGVLCWTGMAITFGLVGFNLASCTSEREQKTTSMSAEAAALVYAKFLKLKNPAARCFIANGEPKTCSLSYENSDGNRAVLSLYCYYDDCYQTCNQ